MQRVRKYLHYLRAVISSTNHSICGSPWTVHREDQWKETGEKTGALMIRNEATLLCPQISATLARRPLNTCRWVAGTQHFKEPSPLGCRSACLAGCQSSGLPQVPVGRTWCQLKSGLLHPLNCRETKPVNSTFAFFFFFFPPK